MAPDPCEYPRTVNCGSHGSCSGGTCSCRSGYSGSSCGTPPDLCEYPTHVNCGSHGSCSGGTCSCTDGYSGSSCAVAPDLCEYPKHVACGHGTCSGGTCDCDLGYQGRKSCTAIECANLRIPASDKASDACTGSTGDSCQVRCSDGYSDSSGSQTGSTTCQVNVVPSPYPRLMHCSCVLPHPRSLPSAQRICSQNLSTITSAGRRPRVQRSRPSLVRQSERTAAAFSLCRCVWTWKMVCVCVHPFFMSISVLHPRCAAARIVS